MYTLALYFLMGSAYYFQLQTTDPEMSSYSCFCCHEINRAHAMFIDIHL